MITCREAEELVERRLDGEMAAGFEQRLSEHLADCPACSRLIEREAAVDAALAAHFADAEPTPLFGRSVLGRLQADDSTERLGWIADALNALGGMAMIALAMRLVGHVDPETAGIVLGVMGGATAVSLYPMLLARWGREPGTAGLSGRERAAP